MELRATLKEKKRIVIKVGTSTVTYAKTGNINLEKLEKFVRVLFNLRNRGKEIIVVSSGAVGIGKNVLGIIEKPAGSVKQACAAVGQARLMMIYQKLFSEYNQMAAQILMTKNTMVNNLNRINARNTFEELLELGAIPVVNENDAVSVDEMDHATKFGDNDRLSAIVAKIVGADLLIMLSDIDGLFDKNPNVYEDATLRSYVPEITEGILASAGGAGSKFGTGGMMSKIKSAQMVFENHSQMVLMNGENPRDILRVLEGAKIGTLFKQEG